MQYVKLTIDLIAILASSYAVDQVRNTTDYSFPPVPAEDRQHGRNENAFLCAKDHPTAEEKQAFLNEIKPVAIELRRKYNIPASAIVGMAVLESCYGYTRTGIYANNFFGLKKWTDKPDGSYQLIGQPDENEGKVIILEKLPNGQLIFDESKRRDNRYLIFTSKADCMRYLVEEKLLKSAHYIPVIQDYQKRLRNGTSTKEASRLFLKGLGNAHYTHKGGNFYMNAVGNVITELKLDELDQ